MRISGTPPLFRMPPDFGSRAPSDRIGAILDAALDCIICIDSDGRVTEWNPAAERTFGWARAEAIGAELAELIVPPELRGAHHAGRDRFLRTGEAHVIGQRIEVPALRKDGARLLVELAITAVESEVGTFFTAYLRDITGQRRTETRRAAQYAIASLLAGARGLEEIGAQILEIVASVGDWQFGSFTLRGADGTLANAMTWHASGHVSAEFDAATRARRFVSGDGLPGRVLASGEPEWVRDFAGETRFPRAPAAARAGLHGAFAFPLTGGSRVLGVVEMLSTSLLAPDEDLLQIAAALGRNIGQFIERERAVAALEEQTREAEAQRRIADEQRRIAEKHRCSAEAASAAKDRFMAALSHELRTPLTPVLIWTSSALAERTVLPGSLREDLHMVRRNIELEARLIDDLLDFTRLGRGDLQLEKSACDVHEEVRHALETVEADAVGKSLAVEWDFQATQPAVCGDCARLRQIFWNLLRNAVKFTPAGGSITLRSRDDRPGWMRVEIGDTGAGIAPEKLPIIFDPFEQAGQERSGGLGLGLAIARMLVELHGGTMEAASAGLGRGATFTVRLECATENGEGELTCESSPTGIERPLRILLVEDHANTLEMLARILRRGGHTVTTASSVGGAREALACGCTGSEAFELIVSDIGLPDGTGWEVMAEARRHIPIAGIALSGYSAEEDIRRSMEAGFTTHLIKPVDVDRLRAAIRAVKGG